MTRTVNAPTLQATTSAPERELRHGLSDGSLDRDRSGME